MGVNGRNRGLARHYSESSVVGLDDVNNCSPAAFAPVCGCINNFLFDERRGRGGDGD